MKIKNAIGNNKNDIKIMSDEGVALLNKILWTSSAKLVK
jgi:hypothetical protein